ncbi:hypothetical protein IMCC12053_508 [Celeribacter marinus]|uniref:Uncharacterized protein n=1 Tax=Celeribacter marinus TaxID=1397108 RepID=A0A0P0A2J5_9RHOB|nr:hypothetical protein IMCC12053_508 [Celeribacter marinus]
MYRCARTGDARENTLKFAICKAPDLGAFFVSVLTAAF